MRKVQLLVSVLLLVLLLVACAPTASPQAPVTGPQVPAPAPAAVMPATPAKPAWETEWEKTVAAAKQEGSVVLYTTMGADRRRIITDPFDSKYGIRTASVASTPAEFFPKIFAEQKAGIYAADVWLSGAATFIQLKGALDGLDPALSLPELTEPEVIKKTWYFGELSWADKAHTMLIGLMDFNEPISINTDLVKAGEITTYRDLLNPKWKGKISLDDPEVAGFGQLWFAVMLEVGDLDVNRMRELATKQELFITRDRRLQVDWLARGKHAIAIATYQPTTIEFIQLGAPITRLNPGIPFVSASTSGIAMLRRQPHPNAAKLFINWLLSQEGATLHSRAVGVQSQRLDAPTAHLEPSKVLGPGLKLFRADNEEFNIKRSTVYNKLVKEVFGK